jgi:putative hydrolase of the HAD superfamily
MPQLLRALFTVIRALIFDLGNVVIPFDFRRGYAAMQPYCSYPAEEIPRRIRPTGLVPRYETGKISSEAFVEELCRALDLRVSFEQFCELWSAIFLPGTLIPEDFLRSLGGRYPLIALSNTNELHFRQVRARYPVIAVFDHLVLSFEAGCAKPDRRIYEQAVACTGCSASECLFIDDVEAYVEGARVVGIEAVRFEYLSQLQSEFFSREIL